MADMVQDWFVKRVKNGARISPKDYAGQAVEIDEGKMCVYKAGAHRIVVPWGTNKTVAGKCVRAWGEIEILVSPRAMYNVFANTPEAWLDKGDVEYLCDYTVDTKSGVGAVGVSVVLSKRLREIIDQHINSVVEIDDEQRRSVLQGLCGEEIKQMFVRHGVDPYTYSDSQTGFVREFSVTEK